MSPNLITIAQARERVRQATRPLQPEAVGIADALGRVLAQDLQAAGEIPPFASSAMDGYALREGPAGRTLALTGESRAGAPWEGTLQRGQTIRISTGAAVPRGANAVIRQEDVEENRDGIQTTTEVVEGQNVRPAGEVMKARETVLRAGTTLGGAELAAAVTAGVSELIVVRAPRVQILCTGDELREPGEPLGPGEIHNSNGAMLVALAKRSGALADSAARLADDRSATEAGLAAALESSDVVIISGGVSVGPHDHVRPALAALGVQERFWGVALQPGKPTWFGVIGEKLVFGLPGNPVSAAVTFSLFARGALLAMQGKHDQRGLPDQAVLGVAVRRNREREQALRVCLRGRDGAIVAVPNGPQGSHVVTSLVGADALALIPSGEGELEAGAAVALEPLAD